MTARERVLRARRRLIAAVAGSAVLTAAAAAMSVVGVAAIIDGWTPLSDETILLLGGVAVGAAVTGAMLVVRRGRAAASVQRVALWIEEHDPRLKFALVTAVDTMLAPPGRFPELQAVAQSAEVESIVRRAARRSIGRASVLFIAAATFVFAARPFRLLESVESRRRAALERPVLPLGNRLLDLTARIEPPAYARQAARTLRDPSGVAALVGSRILVSGAGPARGVTADAAGDTVLAATDGGRWALGLTMPKAPAILTLRDRTYRRLIALEPRTDSAPAARLRLPAADTTYQRVPGGRLVVEAQLTDDVGLAFGYVEYMLSIGSAESFETKVVNGARQPLGHARSAVLSATVRFDTVGLQPGSVLHIRVVAYDFNDVTGPGKGVSETRTLRIAEPVDSTSVNAAPPLPIDSMWVSQRLLNMRTDTLIREKRRLERRALVTRSSVYGNQQEDIRRRALAVIALLEDNGVGGAFETETSTKLREAVELMWTSRTHLGVAEPDTAMPYMKRILKILDEIRLAHRYYLRGLLKPVPVNVERVRLTGDDSGAVTARRPRAQLADVRAAFVARLEAAATLARSAPAAAADSLTVVRIAALSTEPALADALVSAIAALRNGRSADALLARARRSLERRARMSAGPSEWRGIVP